jgi:8-oxo-dGTP pyrophosphatase MutT (NUDIX family)
MTIPQVLVRGNACPWAVSVFDTVLANHGLATTATPTTSPSHNFHYDRSMISLIESQPGVISLDTKNNVVASPSPPLCMGRARSYPSYGSSACPTTRVDHHKGQSGASRQQQPPRHPFVRLAVVGLVLDATGSLLLTRRPSYMRSFPSAWVLPGGTVNLHESLFEAVQREVWEETGIHSNVDAWKMESVWESVYPTTFSNDDDWSVNQETGDVVIPATSIQAHHIVVYLSTILPPKEEVPSASLLTLCAEEVDAAVWLSSDDCKTVIARDVESAASSKLSLYHHTTGTDNQNKDDEVPLQHLVGIYPQILPDGTLGGMAQGSLFAMEEFFLSSSIGSS